MRITTNQLRRIIREEIERALASESIGSKRVSMTREEFLDSLTPEQREFFEAQFAASAPKKKDPLTARVNLSPEEARKARGF